jgi:hypothetical protein
MMRKGEGQKHPQAKYQATTRSQGVQTIYEGRPGDQRLEKAEIAQHRQHSRQKEGCKCRAVNAPNFGTYNIIQQKSGKFSKKTEKIYVILIHKNQEN